MVVAVFSESLTSCLELLGKGRALADALRLPLVALNLGKTLHPSAELIAHGADEVVELQDDSLGTFESGAYTGAVAAALEGRTPEILLIGSSKIGRDLAPSLGARFKCGVATDASAIELEDGLLSAHRPTLGGSCLAILKFTKKPQICTVPSGVFQPAAKDPVRKGKVTRISPTLPASKVRIVEVASAAGTGGRLEDAKTIVAVGRGVKKKEDLKMIEDLCTALGADIGCTRPLSADLHWMDDSKWIGLSGHKVRPKLYFAIGISGQVQHVAGMRDSAIIVSINKDKDAPMVQNSDYYLVGDLYQIVPALIEEIKRVKGN